MNSLLRKLKDLSLIDKKKDILVIHKEDSERDSYTDSPPLNINELIYQFQSSSLNDEQEVNKSNFKKKNKNRTY